MRRALSLGIIAVLLVAVGMTGGVTPTAKALTSQYVFDSTLAATDTAFAFSFPANYILVCNDDSSITIHIDLLGNEATTADFPILTSECLELDATRMMNGPQRQVNMIAASGTPAIRVLALQ